MPQPAQTRKTLVSEYAVLQTDSLERGIKLLRSVPRRPSEAESRKGSLELGKIRFVGALICAGLRYAQEFAAGNSFRRNLPEITDLVIEFVCTDVEGFVVDSL